jgi:3-hydroxy-9,10-secoandrosta-1,3,5(10)-triene-9,17-dione monooxygenase reductase component
VPTAEEFREVMSRFATGVTLITGADDGGAPVGFTANAVTSVSLDPLLILFCADQASNSLPTLLRTGRFRVSVLGAAGRDLARRFSKEILPHRFRDGDLAFSAGGLPAPANAIAWLECRVWSSLPAGDHIIVIGEVLDCGRSAAGDPLVFFGGEFLGLSDLQARPDGGLAGH